MPSESCHRHQVARAASCDALGTAGARQAHPAHAATTATACPAPGSLPPAPADRRPTQNRHADAVQESQNAERSPAAPDRIARKPQNRLAIKNHAQQRLCRGEWPTCERLAARPNPSCTPGTKSLCPIDTPPVVSTASAPVQRITQCLRQRTLGVCRTHHAQLADPRQPTPAVSARWTNCCHATARAAAGRPAPAPHHPWPPPPP